MDASTDAHSDQAKASEQAKYNPIHADEVSDKPSNRAILDESGVSSTSRRRYPSGDDW